MKADKLSATKKAGRAIHAEATADCQAPVILEEMDYDACLVGSHTDSFFILAIR